MLDLHGVKHEDVANTVKRWIEDRWDIFGHVDIIITGKSDQMKSLVKRELGRYKLQYEVELGSIRVFF